MWYTRLAEWLRSETVWDRGLLPRGFDSLQISIQNSSSYSNITLSCQISHSHTLMSHSHIYHTLMSHSLVRISHSHVISHVRCLDMTRLSDITLSCHMLHDWTWLTCQMTRHDWDSQTLSDITLSCHMSHDLTWLSVRYDTEYMYICICIHMCT